MVPFIREVSQQLPQPRREEPGESQDARKRAFPHTLSFLQWSNVRMTRWPTHFGHLDREFFTIGMLPNNTGQPSQNTQPNKQNWTLAPHTIKSGSTSHRRFYSYAALIIFAPSLVHCWRTKSVSLRRRRLPPQGLGVLGSSDSKSCSLRVKYYSRTTTVGSHWITSN